MIIIYIFVMLYGLSMLAILIYSLAQANLLFHFLRYQRSPPAPRAMAYDLPMVTVQLPIFNERYVVERLIDAVATLNYPANKLEIQVLDDSTDITRQLIQNKIKEYPQLNIQYVHREARQGFKAGALKEGLKMAKGEFVAVFDADFVPDPDFLMKTLPYFTQGRVGMVQTRWAHLNRDFSLLTKLQAFALDAHFFVEQVGRNRQGAFINFNGTGGIWRKECILDAGNWQDDTLTEDLDLSYRAQQKGWKFVYRPEIESPAELPPVMSAIKSQQYRWTKGGAECARKHLREVWSQPFSARIKLHAFAHLLNSSVFIAIMLGTISSIPVWWALQSDRIDASHFRYGAVFFIGFFIIACVYIVAFFYTNAGFWEKSRRIIWQLPLFLAVSMGLSLHNSVAVLEGLLGRKSAFIRTPKFNLEEKGKHWKTNSYLSVKMPLLAYMEGLLALVFLSIAWISLQSQVYFLLPFHVMLAVGYGLVFVTSYQSYARS